MRALTLLESLAVEGRQATLHGLIMAHNRILQAGLWVNTEVDYDNGDGSLRPYPIPPWGIAVTDSQFGHVAVFPDARGVLHWTGDISNTVANEINRGEFESSYGNPTREAIVNIARTSGKVIQESVIGPLKEFTIPKWVWLLAILIVIAVITTSVKTIVA